MANRLPKKSKPGAPVNLDVSRGRIDDPTSAFPIGSLLDPESIEGDAVSPLTPPSKPTPAEPAASTGFRPVLGGIDLRWLAVSLLAGGVLAVFVVALFGVVVLLVRS